MTTPRKIHYQFDEGLAIFTLDDGKANTIENTWLDEWEAAIQKLRHDKANGLLIRGRPGMFCAGLDLKVLPTYSMEEMGSFVQRYQKVKTELFCLDLPVVADVSGHALAGGSVLLLGCDQIVTDANPKRIGLNETQVGIVLPEFVIAMAQARLNVNHWTRALIAGEIYDPKGAKEAGFIDYIVDEPEQRSAFALQTARKLASLPAHPYQQVKNAVRGSVITRLQSNKDPNIPNFFTKQ